MCFILSFSYEKKSLSQAKCFILKTPLYALPMGCPFFSFSAVRFADTLDAMHLDIYFVINVQNYHQHNFLWKIIFEALKQKTSVIQNYLQNVVEQDVSKWHLTVDF